MIGLLLIGLIIWWLVARHYKDKRRREQIVLGAFAYKVKDIHGEAQFGDTNSAKEKGALKGGGIVVGRMKDSGKIIYFHPYE
jgi:hypothetical protein